MKIYISFQLLAATAFQPYEPHACLLRRTLTQSHFLFIVFQIEYSRCIFFLCRESRNISCGNLLFLILFGFFFSFHVIVIVQYTVYDKSKILNWYWNQEYLALSYVNKANLVHNGNENLFCSSCLCVENKCLINTNTYSSWF